MSMDIIITCIVYNHKQNEYMQRSITVNFCHVIVLYTCRIHIMYIHSSPNLYESQLACNPALHVVIIH